MMCPRLALIFKGLRLHGSKVKVSHLVGPRLALIFKGLRLLVEANLHGVLVLDLP